MGWAISDVHTPRAEVLCGHYPLTQRKRSENMGMKYLTLNRWLDRTIKQYDITEIYYEEVRRHAGTMAAHAYGGFQAVLQSKCNDLSIPFRSIPVGTVKKHATGVGNASKEMMIHAAAFYQKKVTEDNEADAFWILDCAKDQIYDVLS